MPSQTSTITAADAVIMLSVSGLFSAPQQLQGFAADNIYEIGDQTVTETLMGVDGRLSGGFVFNPVQQTFNIQADSDSNNLFETWANSQRANKTAYVANGTTLLSAIGTEYISTRGFLMSYPPLPSAAKVLQPRRYVIQWQSVLPVPV